MEQWSLIPNMVSLKQDIIIRTQECSPRVQDYKVMYIIEKLFSNWRYKGPSQLAAPNRTLRAPSSGLVRPSKVSTGLRLPGGQERKLSGIARPASQGIPRPGQSILQAPGQFQRLVLFPFSYFICWSSDSDPSKLYLEWYCQFEDLTLQTHKYCIKNGLSQSFSENISLDHRVKLSESSLNQLELWGTRQLVGHDHSKTCMALPGN